MAGRPVATTPPPSPGAARARENRRRQREGLVLVQIGEERFEVTPEAAKRLRQSAEMQERQRPDRERTPAGG